MPPSHRIVRAKDSIENRRARGEISCAECRRHKLKCDKAIPCSTCVRKGCQSICPNGTLAPTHGTRPSAPESVVFDTKLSELSSRIQQLEDALQISHSTVSTAPHPLLAEDLLQIKNRAVASTSPGSENDTVDTDLVRSLGTLTVTDGGTELYIGGPSSDILTHLASVVNSRSESLLALPNPVSYLSKTFPFTPLYLPAHDIQSYIEEKLPTYERATSLIEAYLENLSWFFRPVEREQIMGELIPIVYKKKCRRPGQNGQSNPQDSTPDPQSPTDPHILALLLGVFAAGAAADMTLPPWNDEAELYYHLARAALSLKPVFEGAGLHAVQAISLVGAYDLFACRKNELESSWKIFTFSLSIAASIGLNRDPAHFGLSPTVIQRRRRVFWELHNIDVWESLATGRPVTFTNSVIDCEFPTDTDADRGGDPNGPDSIWLLRYRYTKEMMSEVISKLNPTQAVKYSEILLLDQKIREYDPQGVIARGYRSDRSGISIHDSVRRHQLSVTKDITLLLLHRAFFARALVEDSANPVRTQFGPSFLSTYRSAASINNTLQKQVEENGHYLLRCWPVLGHALHAAVVLGSIAACGTTSALAPQAFVHFDNAINSFPSVQMYPPFEAAMPLLSRLREQAVQALARHGSEIPSQLRSAGLSTERNQDFRPLTTLGQMVQRSREGNFGATPSCLNDISDQSRPGVIFSGNPTSTSTQFSIPLSELNVPTPKQGNAPMTLSTMPGGEPSKASAHGARNRDWFRQPLEQRTDSDGDSEMGQADDASGVTSRSFSQPRDPPVTYPFGGGEASTSSGQPQTRVDQHAYSSMSRSPDGNASNSRLFDFQASPTSPDILNTYTTFSDLPNDDSMPGTSFLGHTLQTQPTSNPFPSSTDSFTFNPLSNLSPEPFFNPDFDVSYDMRSSTVQESFLPLLPGDMEAWRTITKDTRFFGFPGGGTESERGTPK